jgi:hypothetical protein
LKLRLVQQKRWDAAEAYYAKLVEKKTRAESSRSAAAAAWEAGAEDEIEDTMSISQ